MNNKKMNELYFCSFHNNYIFIDLNNNTTPKKKEGFPNVRFAFVCFVCMFTFDSLHCNVSISHEDMKSAESFGCVYNIIGMIG